jgi:alkylation response protein AidB-like acyl-CoA dehydrogenase
MNFDFTESEARFFENLRKRIDRFADSRNLETKDSETSARYLREAMAFLSEAGYLDLGLTQNSMESGENLCLMRGMEILAAASQSLFLSIGVSAHLFGRIIARWGNEEQKERYLLPLRKGKLLGAVGLSEQSMNVDNDPLETIGTDNGAEVKVTGKKTYVINGPLADWTAVVGRTADAHAIFLVKKGTERMAKDDRLHTLGYEGALICSLGLDDCRIPHDQVIVPGNGEDVLGTIRMWENQILNAACLGMMQSSFESARNYANTHQSGGKPIVAYQEVAFKLAEMLTLYQTSQLLAYRAAWMSDANPKEAAELILCAKVFCTESAEKIAGQALQILAGEGYRLGNKAECAYRCAKYAQIAGTSTEIARVKIGDKALGYG